jgi:hypothetical protein
MTRVNAVDFGNVVLVEVANHVTASESESSEAIRLLSDAFGKPAYLISKQSSRSVRYRGRNTSTLNQLRRIDPRNLRWSEYRIG